MARIIMGCSQAIGDESMSSSDCSFSLVVWCASLLSS